MDWLQIALRIVHIAGGILWVGSSVFLHLYVEPTVRALGPQGGPFMRHMTETRKLPVFIAGSGVLTIVAGIILYARASSGFDPDWITSGPGLAFTVGGTAAILALVLGIAVVRPRVVRMGALGSAMASATPTQEQVQEMGSLQRSLRSISILNLVLLGIAVVAMASARYLA